MIKNDYLKEGYRECEDIMKHHAKSYSFATKFLPREMQKATFALYAFVREPDDFVDQKNNHNTKDKATALERFEREFWDALKKGHYANARFAAMADTFRKYEFPDQWAELFLESMHMDLHKKRYKDFLELKQYMLGSAAVVGYFMAHIAGFTDAKSLEEAGNLGYAFQMTNFLRDIDADFHDLGRIYLPQEDMTRFDIREEDIAQRKYSEKIVRWMQFEMQRADEFYASADSYLSDVKSNKATLGFCMASKIYHAIHDKIKVQGYNPFVGRVGTSFFEKTKIMSRVGLSYYLS